MKKVLIITYYWPPMGGGGVQRWLKFTRYLREFGWEPIIYTPSNADLANKDEGLLREIPDNIQVIKTNIWEPFDLYKKFTGKSKDEKVQPGFLQESQSKPILQNMAVWIRGNFFIPDAKKFWIKPSIKFLKKVLIDQKIDAIVSTGPPHSNHLIALGLKKSLKNIPWLADFRDPWTNIDYYNQLMLTSWANKKHKKLEKEVLLKADQVVTVSQSWALDFEKSSGRLPKVITNGYDPEDFLQPPLFREKEKFIITHIGSLNKDRNPYSFWKAVANIVEKDKSLKEFIRIRFIGPTDISVFDQIEEYNLKDIFEHIQHLPHSEVIKYTMSSDLLLLPLNNTPNIDGVIPGKLYEYMASRRPCLCIGKTDGDAALIIAEANSGVTFDFKNVAGITTYLSEMLVLKKNNAISENIELPVKYSRRNLAGEIAKLLDDISH